MTQILRPRVMKNGNNRYFPVTHSEYVIHDKEQRLSVHDVLQQVSPLALTYAELLAMTVAGTLAQGQTYRITDYVTTTAVAGTQSAGHQFDIIVVALTNNSLAHHAWAVKHSGDTYFQNCKLEAWSLNYDINNDTDKYAWADVENGKGVIWWMRDEHGNEAPYDFKNIQFKRYKLKGKNYIHLADSPMSDDDYKYPLEKAFNLWKDFLGTGITTGNLCYYFARGTDEDNYPLTGADVKDNYYTEYDENDWEPEDEKLYVSLANMSDHYDIIAEVEATGEWMYTFSRKETVAASAVDASLNSPNVHNNVIRQWMQGSVLQLNGSVFIAGGSSASFYGNTTGINNYLNTYGNDNNRNTYGNNCYNNTYGNYCQNNMYGNGCSGNTYGNGCSGNTYGNNCYNNTYGNSNSYNTYGNSNYNNTYGNNCYNNTYGNSNSYNTYGNYCYYNTYGNNCYGNTYGNNCYNNTYGNDVCYLDFPVNCKHMHVLDGTQGGGNDDHLTITGVEANCSVCQFVGIDSNGDLQVWKPADLVTANV